MQAGEAARDGVEGCYVQWSGMRGRPHAFAAGRARGVGQPAKLWGSSRGAVGDPERRASTARAAGRGCSRRSSAVGGERGRAAGGGQRGGQTGEGAGASVVLQQSS